MPAASSNRKPLLVLWGLYLVIAAAIFIWAGTIRFHLPQSPLADEDTAGYLGPALLKMGGKGFVHEHGRNFLYPGLLLLLLRAAGDFRAIAFFQHFLGVFGGGLLLLTWERASIFLRTSTMLQVFYRALGLVLTATYLASTKLILYESQIRPEPVFAFFVLLSLFLNVEFIRSCFMDDRKRHMFTFGISSLFTAILLYSLKPAWGFGVISASLPVIVFLCDRSATVRDKCVLIGTSAFLVLILLILPEKHFAKEDSISITGGPSDFFAIHADMIRDQIAADLANGSESPYPKEWLTSVQASLSRDIEMTRTNPQGDLGFNADYIMFQNSTYRRINIDFENDPEKVASFCWYYYKRTLIHQPRRMAGKIFRQLRAFYTIPCPVYQRREEKPIKLGGYYATSIQMLSAYMKNDTAWEGLPKYLSKAAILQMSDASISGRRWVAALHRFLGFSYIFCLAIAITLNVLIFALPRWRRDLGVFALFTLLVYSYNFGNTLTISIAHILSVHRFTHVQLGFTMLAQFLTFVLVLAVFIPSGRDMLRWIRAKADGITSRRSLSC